MVERERPEVWDILDEVIQEHPVMLNRAPTLHRLGIQAFEPVLIEGKAIQLHPLVCAAFNADFDGDQMAVHVPLSVEAQMEARVLMMSTNNILSPASGRPIINPTQDIVLGLYYATRMRRFVEGSHRENSLTYDDKSKSLVGYLRGVFSSPEEVRMAYDNGVVDLHAAIKVRITDIDDDGNADTKLVLTTVGRVLISEVLPQGLPFDYANKVLNKKALSSLIDICYRKHRNKETVLLADRLRTLGFSFATTAGISVCMDDMVIPAKKKDLVDAAQAELEKVVDQYQEGLITDGERYNKIIDIWAGVADRVAEEMMGGIGREVMTDPETQEQVEDSSFNPIYIMADSGARGSPQQMRQLAAMRGLMAKPSGEIIETPITANFREGLTVLQYFISTHGARKGLADTALKTADSGYLTRRLVDVAQDVIVSEQNCGTVEGIYVGPIVESGEIIEPLRDRIIGRVSLEKIKDFEGSVIVEVNQEITEEFAVAIQAAGIERVKIRSVLTCESKRGVCIACYGRNLASGRLVELGEAVGVIAAQSIGEPGTQLTMRTFHIGGTASRVNEQSRVEAKNNGIVRFLNLVSVRSKSGDMVAMNRSGSVVVVDDRGREKERYQIVYGAKLKVEEGAHVSQGQSLVEWDPYTFAILTETAGSVKFDA